MSISMSAKVLWKPDVEFTKNSNMFKFMFHINTKYNIDLNTYEEFHKWSVDNNVQFWSELLDYSGIKKSGVSETLTLKSEDADPEHMLSYKWFPDLKLNFAENLLKFKDKEKNALEYYDETGEKSSISYKELYRQTAKLQKAMTDAGVEKNDRIAGFINNGPEAVIAMLATSAIGAIWSSTSPDFGAHGVIDRFKQIKPKILFAVNGYNYNGKVYDRTDVVKEIASEIPEIEKIVMIDRIGENTEYIKWNNFIDNEAKHPVFVQNEFNHPLYIMYSSGTTGLPKSIVHGAGGTLLQHYKELVMHTNLGKDDKIMYFTTTGWMMWNWLISSLMTGCTVVLIDGSPAYPDLNRIWKLIADKKINIFGTSPKFLRACEENNIEPNSFDLSQLKTILSTGAPLTEANFEWVYNKVKPDVMLSSISGGTDIISCFMLGSPIKPVVSGELQCRGLGMKVEAYNDDGKPVINEKGELVCTKPFPSMPVYFWNDDNNSKYKSAYFEDYPGIWNHGDYIKITNEGGIVVYGRSDATLNPGGIRIGTSEIYRVVNALPEIQDSLVVGQKKGDDVRVILFVILTEGSLTEEISRSIKSAIKNELTPRHIPEIILQVHDIPHTLNGKKVEIAVTKILNGDKVLNKASLANPNSLDEYEELAQRI